MMTQKVLGIVGWKNSGKTSLVESLLREMANRGLSLSTIKHAHHNFDIDVPGKDSYRHRQAGAGEVLVVSAQRWALMHELPAERELSLSRLVARLAPCDLILAEGFKKGPHPKIEVARFEREEGLIADQDANVIAVATDNPLLARHHRCLPLNEVAAIADFVCSYFELATSNTHLRSSHNSGRCNSTPCDQYRRQN